MNDEVWKDFFADNQTKRVLDSSEVWRNYSQAELVREQLREVNAANKTIDNENQLMATLDEFRQKIAENPALKAELKKASDILEQHPELKEKVDQNFINGLELLDLGD
jgi:hypothetical protein